jgi:putative membrane protein
MTLNGDAMAGIYQMGEMMDGGWWGWPFMGIWMAGLWLVLVVIAVLVYQDAKKRDMNAPLWALLVLVPMFGFVALVLYLVLRESGKPSAAGGKSAGAILDERYARGEISRDEYLRMKDDLGGGKGGTA